MIVELWNCSLEIGHIGTREELEFVALLERTGFSAAEAGKALREVIEQVMEAARELGQQLAEFLKTDEGKQFVESYGVGK